jgi:hypothetical protein
MLTTTANPTPPRLPDHRVALLAALVLAAVVGTAPKAHADFQLYAPPAWHGGGVVLRVDACADKAGTDCWFVRESKRPWASEKVCQARADQIIGDAGAIRVLLKGQPPARRWAKVRCQPLHDQPEA